MALNKILQLDLSKPSSKKWFMHGFRKARLNVIVDLSTLGGYC